MCDDLIEDGFEAKNDAFDEVIANLTSMCQELSDFLPEEETSDSVGTKCFLHFISTCILGISLIGIRLEATFLYK